MVTEKANLLQRERKREKVAQKEWDNFKRKSLQVVLLCKLKNHFRVPYQNKKMQY